MKSANRPHLPVYISVATGSGYSHAYSVGDVVLGVVRVDPKTRPQRVNITFRGRMKCAITRSNGQSSVTYKEKPEFFSYTLELFSSSTHRQSYDILGQGVTKDDRVELPFEFRFPDRTLLNVGAKWRDNKGFAHQPGGPLPPSFLFDRGRNHQIVEYFLEAKLFKNSAYSVDVEVRCPLIFQPPAPPDIPVPLPTVPQKWSLFSQRGIITRTRKLHPDYDPNEKLRDKLKYHFTHKDETPFANFKVDAKCPMFLFPGKPIELSLSLEHLERSKDIPDPPPVFIRHIRVRLLTQGHIRVAFETVFRSNAQDIYEAFNTKTCLLDREFREADGLLYDGMLVHTNTFPASTTPSFVTYGLKLEQLIEVKIWGECAKERFELVPVEGKVVIVQHQRLREAAQESEVEKPPAVDEEDAPPPYMVLDKSG